MHLFAWDKDQLTASQKLQSWLVIIWQEKNHTKDEEVEGAMLELSAVLSELLKYISIP